MADSGACLRHVDLTWPSSGVQACDNADLELKKGRIHALVGENGAGKTTLGHILAGILRPDSGLLKFSGENIRLSDRQKGVLDGIGLVRQRSIWPDSLEVWEAAILGRSDAPGKRREALSLFTRTAESWGIEGLEPTRRLAGMDAAARQRAELCAALMFNPKVLILDEPSSAWEEGRASEFRNLMQRLKKQDLAVLLITHRLEDVFEFAEDVTVMRHGAVRGNWPTEDTNPEKITGEMFGRFELRAEDTRKPVGEWTGSESPVLRLSNIGLKKNTGRKLSNIGFSIRSGEILGICGLREEGLTVLEDVVSGNIKADFGYMEIRNRKMDLSSTALRKSGLRYVPSDSIGRGASLKSTLAENMVLLNTRSLSRRGVLHPLRMKQWTESSTREAGVSGRPDQPMMELSGGNLRKAILQRELSGATNVLILADPTWGLDERSRQNVHGRIREQAEKGIAVLLLASDLDEALALSHRMAILSGGFLSEIRPTDKWDRHEAARCIAGGINDLNSGGSG